MLFTKSIFSSIAMDDHNHFAKKVIILFLIHFPLFTKLVGHIFVGKFLIYCFIYLCFIPL